MLLSAAPVTTPHNRAALTVALLVLVVLGATLPFAHRLWTRFPGFILIQQPVLAVSGMAHDSSDDDHCLYAASVRSNCRTAVRRRTLSDRRFDFALRRRCRGDHFLYNGGPRPAARSCRRRPPAARIDRGQCRF